MKKMLSLLLVFTLVLSMATSAFAAEGTDCGEQPQDQEDQGNETRWKCLCQNCGRTVEVSSYWLRHSDPYGHCKCTRFNKPL